MARIEKTVFVSYRRTDESWGLAIFQDLTQHGYDVFIDYDGIASGNFESVILENIRARAHFLVLLTPTALERCGDPKDWMRREVEAALDSKRNIVPLMLATFDFSKPAIATQLTGKLAKLKEYNGLEIPKARFFSSEMERLRNKFLNVPVDAAPHSASDSAQQAAKEQKDKATLALEEALRQPRLSPEEQQRQEETQQARHRNGPGMIMSSKFTLPRGYTYLRADCERFFTDHPDYHRNVFIMTRFDNSDPLLKQLDEQLRKTLCCHGLVGMRADDRIYPKDNQLWTNVCIYMLCCNYGVAVLEDRAKDEFNPNVALEYGFMRALDKRTLLLTDSGFRNLRADIVGTVREEFDITDLAHTLVVPIERWIHSLGVDLKAGRSNLQQQAFKAYRRLMNIKCAQFVRDETKRKKEENDEFWYFGEEINAYGALLLTHPHPDHERAVEDAELLVASKHDFTAINKLIERFAVLAR